MTPKEVKHQIRLKEWANRYRTFKSSGCSVKQWCAQEGISEATFYARKRAVESAACEKITERQLEQADEKLANLPAFAQLAVPAETVGPRPPAEPAPFIHVAAGNISVKISNGVDQSLAAAVLKAVLGQC
jgi:AraC-like DNA-binding protein